MNWLASTIFLLFALDLKIHSVNCENDHIISEKLKDLKINIDLCTANKTDHKDQLSSTCYNCSSRNTKAVKSEQLPNIIVRAYVGAAARLPCQLRVWPIDKTQVVWMYTESTENMSFNLMEEKDTAVIDEDLTLYNTRPEDTGVYRCQVGQRYGGLVVLEVTNEEKYTVVKPQSSRGPYPSPPEAVNQSLVLFTNWSPWSECSRCDKVGRRRRYGICYVALNEGMITNKTANYSNYTSNEIVNDKILKLFHDYPKGIPCRSQILPPLLRSLPEIQIRFNEIMIALCKVPCKDGLFEMRSDSAEVLERANNTAGIYSLCQKKPLQLPLVARETMFFLPGAKVFIRCPGSIPRDVPVTWRIGQQPAAPRHLDAASGGRVHLNARDHIVFNYVDYADADVYSCWQDNILAGVVKVEISQSADETYRKRFMLVAAIALLILLLKLTKRISRYRIRKSYTN